MKRRIIFITTASLAITFSLWCFLVLIYSPILPAGSRIPAAVAMALASLGIFVNSKSLRALWLLLLASTFFLWFRLKPSNDLDWQPDVAVLPWASIKDDTVTIHNIRDNKYRSETDYEVRYNDQQVRLSEMTSVDMFVSYWSGKSIAHVIVSFGFNNRDFIAFSIETRKTRGQEYSSIDGFFRNYTLTYVVAEERDVIALRTTYRHPQESVYLLRPNFSREKANKFFLEYVKKINSLQINPEFYNTITTNCTTQVLLHARSSYDKPTYSWKILLSGYTPEYLYERGSLNSRYSLEELMKDGLINKRAQEADEADDFSVKIREGVP